MASTTSQTKVGSSSHLGSIRGIRIYLNSSAYVLKPGQPSPGWPSLLRHPIAVMRRYRNINLFPIDYAFRPRLRGRLTLRRLALRRNPWSFGEGGFHLPLSLLMSAFALLIPPANFPVHLQRLTERSSTTHTSVRSAASVYSLSPVTSSAQADSTSELLRFL